MTDRIYFPQPKNLEDRYMKIQREYVERNPTGYGYARGAKIKLPNNLHVADTNEFIQYYIRRFPNVKRETAIKQAIELYNKYKTHPDPHYYNPYSWTYEKPHVLE